MSNGFSGFDSASQTSTENANPRAKSSAGVRVAAHQSIFASRNLILAFRNPRSTLLTQQPHVATPIPSQWLPLRTFNRSRQRFDATRVRTASLHDGRSSSCPFAIPSLICLHPAAKSAWRNQAEEAWGLEAEVTDFSLKQSAASDEKRPAFNRITVSEPNVSHTITRACSRSCRMRTPSSLAM